MLQIMNRNAVSYPGAAMIALGDKKGIELRYQPNVIAENIEAITEEQWLNNRKTGIGGSDAGTIMGESHFMTRSELLYQKRGSKIKEIITAKKQFMFDFGHAAEPALLSYYSAKTENEIFVDRRQVRHSIYPFMLADSDGFAIDKDTGETILLECKTSDYNNRYGWKSGVFGYDAKIGNLAYLWQARHYMSVWNVNRCDIIIAFGNNADDICIVTINRDLDQEKFLIEEEAKFWQLVKSKDDKAIILEDSLDNNDKNKLINYIDEYNEENMPEHLIDYGIDQNTNEEIQLIEQDERLDNLVNTYMANQSKIKQFEALVKELKLTNTSIETNLYAEKHPNYKKAIYCTKDSDLTVLIQNKLTKRNSLNRNKLVETLKCEYNLDAESIIKDCYSQTTKNDISITIAKKEG